MNDSYGWKESSSVEGVQNTADARAKAEEIRVGPLGVSLMMTPGSKIMGRAAVVVVEVSKDNADLTAIFDKAEEVHTRVYSGGDPVTDEEGELTHELGWGVIKDRHGGDELKLTAVLDVEYLSPQTAHFSLMFPVEKWAGVLELIQTTGILGITDERESLGRLIIVDDAGGDSLLDGVIKAQKEINQRREGADGGG